MKKLLILLGWIISIIGILTMIVGLIVITWQVKNNILNSRVLFTLLGGIPLMVGLIILREN